MKKVLSVVLAVAMVLGCVASLAFVVGDMGSITNPTNSALKVENFYVTSDDAMRIGVQAYSDLVELTDAPYDVNSVIRLAVELAVYNPNYLPNGVKPTSGEGANGHGNLSTLTFKSNTVSFALSGSTMLLYTPYVMDVDLPYFTNMVRASLVDAGTGLEVSKDGHTMDLDVYYYTGAWEDGRLIDIEYVTNVGNTDDNGLHLYGVSDDTSTIKTDYTLVLTGVTTGSLEQEGLVTLEREDKAGDTFEEDGEVVVTKNGHTYWIQKRYAKGTDTYNKYWLSHKVAAGEKDLRDGTADDRLNWTHLMTEGYPSVYDVNAVGYVVRVLLNDNDQKTVEDLKDHGTWGVIGMFETEQVRWGSLAGDLEGTDVETYGRSLGFDYWGPAADRAADNGGSPLGGTDNWIAVGQNILTAFGDTEYYKGDPSKSVNEVFKAGKDGDHLYGGDGSASNVYQDEYMTAREALTTFLSDFGFGTGSQYTYKVQDSDFEEATTYEQLGQATYNGNAIVVPQPEEDDDVDEGTDPGEIPDEGDIGEELPDEGDIDEEPVPDEPVPETGDASAAVAVALTAAALVAAAGLAVVLKKAR